MVESGQNARWLHSQLAGVSLGRILRWLPVMLAASFPIAALAALIGARPDTAPPLQIDTPMIQSHSPAVPDAFTAEVKHWSSDILRWSAEYELPPELVATVMQIESCGHPSIHSNAGAAGLFQVMPFHFGADEDPLDPETNALRGLSYLARSLELAEGNQALALAGYNGGHGQIGRAITFWPAETQRYVRWGIAILSDIQRGTVPSPGVDSWLEAGGAGLCQRAAQALSSG